MPGIGRCRSYRRQLRRRPDRSGPLPDSAHTAVYTGSALAGRVAAVGERTRATGLGASIAGLLMDFGAYSSHVLPPAERAVVLPHGISSQSAASVLGSYSTLVFATTHRVAIARDEWVIVLGAGGGLGLAAIDVAAGLGARVLGVASTEKKRATAAYAGAVTTPDYTDLKAAIRTVTAGADVVFDPVGGPASDGPVCLAGRRQTLRPRIYLR